MRMVYSSLVEISFFTGFFSVLHNFGVKKKKKEEKMIILVIQKGRYTYGLT